MEVKTLVSPIYQANCYIVLLGNDVIIIDPCVKLKEMKPFLEGKQTMAIFLTHGHADHFWGLQELAKETDARIYCHKKALEKLENWKNNYSFLIRNPFSIRLPFERYQFVEEGSIVVGDEKLTIFETPGHSDCSISILIRNSLFSGDTLFKESVGRTDLLTSNHKDLQHSLNKLMRLPRETLVYPGHDSTTSIAEEMMRNPYLINKK